MRRIKKGLFIIIIFLSFFYLKAMHQSKEKIYFLTNDNDTISLGISTALQSKTLAHLLEDAEYIKQEQSIDEPIPLPNISTQMFRAIKPWMKKSAKNRFNTQALNSCEDSLLLELITVANYLDYSNFLNEGLNELIYRADSIMENSGLNNSLLWANRISKELSDDLVYLMKTAYFAKKKELLDCFNATDFCNLCCLNGDVRSVFFSPSRKKLSLLFFDTIYCISLPLPTQTMKESQERSFSFLPTIVERKKLFEKGCYSADEKRFYTTQSEDKKIVIWDEGGSFISSKAIKNIGYSKALCCHPNGKSIAISSFYFDGKNDLHKIKILRSDSLELIQELSGHKKSICALTYSSDGNILASGSGDEILIWNNEGDCINRVTEYDGEITDLCFSKNNDHLAAASLDLIIRIWQTKNYTAFKLLDGHKDIVTTLCYSLDGNYLASGSEDTTIRLWALPDYTCTRIIECQQPLFKVMFNDDSKRLISVSIKINRPKTDYNLNFFGRSRSAVETQLFVWPVDDFVIDKTTIGTLTLQQLLFLTRAALVYKEKNLFFNADYIFKEIYNSLPEKIKKRMDQLFTHDK